MSGIEVIGVIASASQLVRYVLDIIDYTKTLSVLIKSSSCPFQHHRQHLENLVSAVETIRRTPILQTNLIKTHLQTLLNRTASLHDTLKPFSRVSQQTALGKVWTAIQAHKAEAHILKDLNILERDKSNLLLCITTSYGPILHGIQEKSNSDLVVVKDTMPENAAGTVTAKNCVDQQSGSDIVPVANSTPEQNSESSTFIPIVTYFTSKHALTYRKVVPKHQSILKLGSQHRDPSGDLNQKFTMENIERRRMGMVQPRLRVPQHQPITATSPEISFSVTNLPMLLLSSMEQPLEVKSRIGVIYFRIIAQMAKGR